MLEFHDNPIQSRGDLQEALALHLRDAEAERASWPPVASLESIEDAETYRQRAADALKALDALGVHLVPFPASEAMSNLGYDAMRDVGGADFVEDGAHHVLKSMLFASPYAAPLPDSKPARSFR